MDGGASSSAASASYPLYNPSMKRSLSTMADNTYRSSSPDSLFMAQDDHLDDEQRPQRRRLNSTLALPPRPPRFAGDGYDYRRPVMSSQGGRGHEVTADSRAAVIDLTADDDMRDTRSYSRLAHDSVSAARFSRTQRLPRFHGRNIIDVEGENEEEGPRSGLQTEMMANPSSSHSFLSFHRTQQSGSSSDTSHHPRFSILQRPQRTQPQHSDSDMDDLELLEERPRRLTRSASRSHTQAEPLPRSITPYPTTVHDAIDLTGEDDDVVHLESRVRPQTNLDRPTVTAGMGTRNVVDPRFPMIELGGRLFNRLMDGFGGAFGGQHDTVLRDHTHNHHRNEGPHHNHYRHETELRVRRPGAPAFRINPMDYGAVAFDLGIAGGNQPPTPKYEPPEAAKAGFTRSPGEDEVVVCPNCGDELAMGDTEEKQQIWVIKKCGHAYCGICALNRAKGLRTAKKGKGKAPVSRAEGPAPFRTCVVDGCKESASSKSMVHVFLGS